MVEGELMTDLLAVIVCLEKKLKEENIPANIHIIHDSLEVESAPHHQERIKEILFQIYRYNPITPSIENRGTTL